MEGDITRRGGERAAEHERVRAEARAYLEDLDRRRREDGDEEREEA